MAEQEQYKSNGENILTDIDDETYSSFYDTLTEKMITPQENLKLYKGTAWHLQDNGTMQPGARGVLEFYVIPQVDGLTEIFFAINIAGYQKTSDEKNPVALVEDSVLNDLLKGHILFFEKLDDVDGYSGWLGGDEKEIRVKDKSGSLQKDLPYKVTIYWIWPKRYRNFIYHQRSTQGDLFATESGDYKALISFINENQKKFFYNYKKPMESITTEIDMNDEAYTLGTAYYNAADEYIGTNIKSNSIAFYVHPRLL